MMNKVLLTVVFLLIGISPWKNLAYSQTASSLQNLSDVITKEGRDGAFSGSVLFAKNDSILLIRSAGYADKKQNILNDTNTMFNIASTGKLFTRIIILQLIREEKLQFTDTIGKFFKGFDQPGARDISVLHLLEHQSGLGDVSVNKKYMKPEVYTSPANVVKLIATEKLDFAPGTGDRYSNSGYYLLGEIIAAVTGKSFADNVKERIFLRLGMSRSGFANIGDVVPGHASPYKKNGKLSTPDAKGEPPTGGGSEYSTVTDLYKIYRSIMYDEQLLPDQYKAMLFNRFQQGKWDEIKTSGKITGYLGGDTRGWSAKLTFMFYKQSSYCTVILANYDNMAHPLDIKLRSLINK